MKFHRDARSKHKQLTLASSHIYIQKEKATQNSPTFRLNSIVDSEIFLSLRLGDRIRCRKKHIYFATDIYTYGNSASGEKKTKHCIADKMKRDNI
jgi:hypothetical protein